MCKNNSGGFDEMVHVELVKTIKDKTHVHNKW